MQKGRSMVEMLGVLILIAVLTVSVLSVWTQIRMKMQITQSQNEIFQIAQNTSSLYSWTRDYVLLDGTTENMEELCKNDKIFKTKKSFYKNWSHYYRENKFQTEKPTMKCLYIAII